MREKILYNLTNPQKSIWLTEQTYGNSNVNTICGTIFFKEDVDIKLLKETVNIFVQKNDALRTRIIVEEGEPKQFISDVFSYEAEAFELNSIEELNELESNLSKISFNLLDSNLFVFKVFKLKDGTGGIIGQLHHLISDAWSFGIMSKQLKDIYEKLLLKEDFDVAPSYVEFIEKESEYITSDKFVKNKEYWENIFSEVPDLAYIKHYQNDNVSTEAKRYKTELSLNLCKTINEYSRDNKTSAYSFLMSIYSIYLARVSGLNNVVIGTPFLNRSNFKEKNMMGMFVNTLPNKLDIDWNISFNEFVKYTTEQQRNMFRHSKYPYDKLLSKIRKEQGITRALYDILMSYQNARNDSQESSINYHTYWNFNGNIGESMQIHVYDMDNTGSLQIFYDYQTNKFTEKEVKEIHNRILYIIEQVLQNDISLNEIEIVTPDEKERILYDFNNTKADYPKDKTITELFEEQVEKTPDNIAVVFEDEKLTYRELNEKANSLANYLKNNNVKKNDVVSIFLDKSLESIIAILATLKCGATYMPIDIDYPDKRITFMIDDANSKIVLSSSKLTDKLSFINSRTILNIDLSNENIYNMPCDNLHSTNNYNDSVYIMYTSGSTGNPKGVIVTNQNIIRLVKNTNYIKFEKQERILQTGSIVFDACTFEIWGALLNGFELYIIKKQDLLDPALLEQYLYKNKITTLWLTAPLFNQLCESNPNMFAYAKKLLTGGDVLSPKHINLVKKACPNLTVINGYGPTENTTFSTCFTIDEFYEDSIPIGFPIANSTCYIVSPNLKLLPVGIPGELLVGGDGVSKGYLNNPEFTSKKFINNPFDSGMLYKTGDLAKWRPDGSIDFIGRVDNQVKIRGFRVELNEITLRIQEFPNIKECITIVKTVNNEKVICSYYSSTSPINISLLKDFLENVLPHYSIPTYFIELDNLPINTNGKVDTKKLPEPKNLNSKKEILLPRNDIDSSLIDLLKSLLNINNISIDDSFFHLGGDSLSAINLCAQIQNKFKVQLFVKDILEHPIIKDLSDLISSKENIDRYMSIEKAENALYYPVSSAQENIYMASQMAGESSLLYNIPGGVIFNKLPNIKKLENCFNELILRHESLRTYFEIENENIVQKIIKDVKFKIEVEENILPFEELNNSFKDFVAPFDLSKAPLLRAKFVKLTDGKCALFVDMHHIISDGTSLSIFIKELCKLYNDKNLEQLQFTYKDFAYSENNALSSDKFKQAEEYWVNQFKDELPVLNMPTNYARPAVKSYDGAKVYSNFNSEITAKINNVSKELGVTPYMLLLSVYYVLLSKYTSQEDIIVGSPIVGRNLSELYNIVGMFVNTLPIRAKINSSSSFKEFLNTIKDICLENYKHQDYPLNELISKLQIQRDTSRAPLFNTIFTYQNNGLGNIEFEDLDVEFYIPDTKISKFDFSLEIVPENDILNLNFEYCTKLFTKQFIENFANHYKNILINVLNNIDIKISNIEMLSEKEKNKIIYEFNNTRMDYPKDKTISQLFEEQVKKTPDNVAVVFENEQLTYNELNEKANSLAYYLRNKGIGRNDIVGIMVNRSLEMIVSILAVLKSGACYIPIDPEYPQDRVEYMLNNSNAKMLLTFETLNDKVSFDNKLFIELNNNLYNSHKGNLDNINTPEDTCYVIYTSGSTGLPKGVILKHKNIVNFVFSILEKIPFTINDTIISITTISFDIFVLESILPLLNGIKTVIASEKAQTDIILLNKICAENAVTIVQTTPSRMLSYTTDMQAASFLNNIKYFLIGGEPFNPLLLKNLQSLKSPQIYNMYGPTETAVWSSIKDLSNTDKINIGTPIGNTQTYILDKYLLPCPINVPGELYIAGDGVGKGYLNRIDLTNKAFIPNPFIPNTLMYKTGDLCKLLPNGEIEYIERIDNQVKIRGLRIELGEIESKMLSFPNIKKACVIKQTINNRDFISAYFTITKRVNISELRKYLSNYLPKYMVPSYFTVLDDFPYTPNGKINKKALPIPKEILSNSDEKYIAPKTDLQIKLANIFEQILNINPIGINDNFFELGGDSILAMNLNIELKKLTDAITYADIFTFPTIAKLEQKINSLDNNENISLEENYDKYNNILENNLIVPKKKELKYNSIGNVLLTGGTGFLGIHILDSFIKNEKGNIYCIIREETGLTAQTKLHQKLNYYFGNKYDKLIGKRIFAVTGDICSPGFGLNQEELLTLANNINIVINTAARVAHFGNYSDFYNTNVKSVKYMLDFCKSFNKKFYQVSTLSVSGNSLETSTIKQNIEKETLFKENNLYIGQSLDNVYVKSKFEAECLVLDAISNGLDAYILRMGNLMPRFKDGVFQENISENAYINRLVGFIKVGLLPDYLKDIYLELTPIDISANAIIKLIAYPNSNNRVFHLFNNNHVYLKQIIKHLEKLNPDFEVVNENVFKNKIKKLLNDSNKKQIVSSLANDFDKDLHFNYFTDIIIKSENTIKYLEKIGFAWPKITKNYLNKFIDLLRKGL